MTKSSKSVLRNIDALAAVCQILQLFCEDTSMYCNFSYRVAMLARPLRPQSSSDCHNRIAAQAVGLGNFQFYIQFEGGYE